MIPFELDNLEAYKLLLRIELAVRESLRQSLESEHGSRWRNRIPGVLLKKIRSAEAEEKRPQFDYLRLGPLYYLTIGELIPLLEQKSGRATLNRLGGDCFIKLLENILGPRNAVCHARSVSAVGLVAIRALYAQVEAALTPEGLDALISTPDVGISQYEAAHSLMIALEQSKQLVCRLQSPVPMPDIYALATNQYWWGVRDVVEFDCSAIEAAVKLIEDYNRLPTGLGSAAARQHFVETQRAIEQIDAAIAELKRAQ